MGRKASPETIKQHHAIMGSLKATSGFSNKVKIKLVYLRRKGKEAAWCVVQMSKNAEHLDWLIHYEDCPELKELEPGTRNVWLMARARVLPRARDLRVYS